MMQSCEMGGLPGAAAIINNTASNDAQMPSVRASRARDDSESAPYFQRCSESLARPFDPDQRSPLDDIVAPGRTTRWTAHMVRHRA
jgi:hypothetical protein